MRFLLATLVLFLMLSTVFGFDPGPAPGVKIKNALLYLLVLGLALRLTLDRSFRLQLPAVPILFGLLIGYALLTYVVIVLMIDYPHYDVLRSGFNLKNSLIDQMLFFLVFFYGLRSDEDALFILKVLLAAWALSHIMAMLDALGLFHVGDIEQRSDGRVQGAIGESNQYGAFVALSLPAIVASIAVTHGLWRMFWIAAAVITAATLVMTVSRGAFVATLLATLCGLWIFRRDVPARRLAMWALGGCAAVVLILVIVVAAGFGDLLYTRVIGQSSSADLGDTSSGRTEIWATALNVMFETPITLLTGFGWGAYNAMPFRFATHNHYLAHWFNLGALGLTCSILLFVMPMRTARAALQVASGHARPVLMAFVFATVAIAAAVFFVDLYLPWLYYWAYAGVVMRLAANALDRPVGAAAAVPAPQSPRGQRVRDMHGWTAAS